MKSRASAGINVFDMNPGTDPGGERERETDKKIRGYME